MKALRPRRSCLYMPGSNARALAKAATLPADVVILDLEDAVAPEEKAQARAQVRDTVIARPFGPREVVVRINALATPWGAADLKQAVAARPDAILAPKVSSAADVEALQAAIDAAGGGVELWAMIETPRGVLNSPEIAACASRSSLCVLVAGSNDLAKDLRVVPDPARQGLQVALSAIVLAGRAAGLAVIDGVFNGIGDAAGLEAECLQGRRLGFDGKSLIHPSQIEAANRLYAPTDEERERATAIVAAFAEPANAALGVLEVNGEMVERLHLEEARLLLSFCELLEGQAPTSSRPARV